MQNPSLLTWISQRKKADIHMTPSPFWRWIIFTKHTQGLLRREFASIFFSAPPTTRIACLGKALYDFWCDFTRVEKHLFHAARQSGSNFTLHELLHIKSYPETSKLALCTWYFWNMTLSYRTGEWIKTKHRFAASPRGQLVFYCHR